MSVVFADTSFYQALLNPSDRWHGPALRLSDAFRGRVMTSEYVLCELGALMSRGALRGLFLDLVRAVQEAPNVDVVSALHELFEAGLDLFANRDDKEWSLTDCISFTLMRRNGIAEAFASDHHFEQAGFRRLLG